MTRPPSRHAITSAIVNVAAFCAVLVASAPVSAGVTPFPLAVLPAEHKKITDPQTGAELTFLTTDPAADTNLYYEQRSWFSDSSLILFLSSRKDGGVMGYLTATGELVRITTPKGGLGGPTAARDRNSLFAMRGSDVVEVALNIQPSANPAVTPSRVTATERVICTIPDSYGPSNTALTESCDGKYLAVGVGGRGDNKVRPDGCVLVISVQDGKIDELHRTAAANFSGHVVFSRANPNLVSFGDAGCWLHVKDITTKQTVFKHKQVEGEFATHHCWWVGDTITFCGGFHPQPNEDADVKVIDIHSGEVRIIGKGSWWPEAKPIELAHLNWWHSCGHEGGRWVAADNWHGDIGIFHAKTTRTYWLTRGHRTYGKGQHPEVGWDRNGEQVIFASHMLGNVDVCVATIPQAWQDAWADQLSVK